MLCAPEALTGSLFNYQFQKYRTTDGFRGFSSNLQRSFNTSLLIRFSELLRAMRAEGLTDLLLNRLNLTLISDI